MSLVNKKGEPKFKSFIELLEDKPLSKVIETLGLVLRDKIIGKREYNSILKQVIINKNNKLGL